MLRESALEVEKTREKLETVRQQAINLIYSRERRGRKVICRRDDLRDSAIDRIHF